MKRDSILKSLADRFIVPRLRADQARLDELVETEDVVRSVCQRRGRGTILANQHPDELFGLCEHLQSRPPNTVVEIGTARGGTLYVWSRLVAAGGLVISIDKPGAVGSVRAPHLAVYQGFGDRRKVRVECLASDSRSLDTHRQLRQFLDGRVVDFLFIDGDHSYQGVRADFESYKKYVAPTGRIALHDIAIPLTNPRIQVQRFWDQLVPKELTKTAIVAEPGRSPGIGLITLRPIGAPVAA